jgi:hypothetical protein
LYSNGVFIVSKTASVNAVGLHYVPDLVNPLIIGSGNNLSAQTGGTEFSGAIAEVAIYPAALSQEQLNAHYLAGSGSSDAYASTILGDGPSYYFRLNEPALTTYPDPATYPVANNYGALGTSAKGAYQPGTTPGVAGPAYSGFGPSSHAVAINGFYGGVEIGASNLPAALNPTNHQPVSVAAWFRSNPADSRFQEIASHGDNSWRLSFNGNNGSSSTAPWDAHFNPGAGPELGGTNLADVLANGVRVNDGNWHMAVGVSDGATDYLYVDGILFKTGTPVANITGSSIDALLGGSPSHMTPSYNTANIRYFNGQIAHVAFWTNALSASDVQQLFGAAAVPPSIVLQPQSATNNAGTTATFSVGVRGSSPFSYQWYKNGSQISGATSSSLVFNPVNLGNAGNYFVTVANAAGSVTSAVAQLTVYSAPVIVQQTPTSVQVFSGTSPTLRVSVIGPSPAYQWSRNGSPLSGATASSYTVANVAASGTYTCAVTNSFGSTPSAPISLTVLADPAANYPLAVLADHPISYYRLGESSGTAAYDYAGGLNATYTNVLLGQPGYSPNDPETSPLFGPAGGNSVDSFAGYVSSFMNFAAPSGTNSSFSIEAWANGGYGQTLDAGIVALGYGNGGEQFDLDTGANSPTRNFRFIVRDAAGGAHVINGTVGPHDNNWHHLVGVCDQANGSVRLYVDGLLNNTTTIGTNSGILAWSAPLSIGSRQSGAGTDYDNQFSGNVNDVSIYNYALNTSQVQAHYFASGVAPFITQQPVDTTVNEGSTAQFTVVALGSTPLAYQWYDIGAGNIPIPGATTSSLTLSNATIAMSGDAYYVVVTNLYGQVQSSAGTLTVQGGPPSITVDISPLFSMGYAGTPITFSVTANGTAPLHYQWLKNSAPIAGATQSGYSFLSLVGTNTYSLTVTNNYGTANSSTATVVGLPVPTLNPSDYTYKMKITFAGYNRGEALVSFPALVQLDTNVSGFSYGQFASPTGGDLRFTDASGTREIPHEIDEWNTSGASAVWVQVPSLSGTNDAIWAYWGNPAATTPLSWSTNGETWVPAFGSSAPYEVVYHLKEGAFPFADGTTLHPATNGVAPGTAVGIVGTGGAFGGSAWLDAGTNDLGDVSTLSAWVNIPTIGSIQTLWANQHGGYGAPGFALFVNTYGNTDGKIDFASGDGTAGNESQSGTGSVGFGQWHLIEVAVNRTNGTAEFYVDGSDIYSSSSIVPTFPTLADLRLGIFVDNFFGMHGTIDEARVRHEVNSANWVWADYMTVAQNSTLESYSSVTGSVVTLTYTRSGNNLILSWPQGTLQSATQVTGPYGDMTGVSSPYTAPLVGPQKYFRVRVR